MLLPMIFNSIHPLLRQTYMGELLKSNEKTKEYGLSLTAEDADKMIEVRSIVLQNCGRVELELDVIKGLMESFCTSSYINDENYVSILNELQEIFYYVKNETEDKIADDKLIGIMKEYFENACGGSVDFLKSTLESFARNFRQKTQIKELSEEGDQ